MDVIDPRIPQRKTRYGTFFNALTKHQSNQGLPIVSTINPGLIIISMRIITGPKKEVSAYQNDKYLSMEGSWSKGRRIGCSNK